MKTESWTAGIVGAAAGAALGAFVLAPSSSKVPIYGSFEEAKTNEMMRALQAAGFTATVISIYSNTGRRIFITWVPESEWEGASAAARTEIERQFFSD